MEIKEKQNSKKGKCLLLMICRRNYSRDNIRDKCSFQNREVCERDIYSLLPSASQTLKDLSMCTSSTWAINLRATEYIDSDIVELLNQ